MKINREIAQALVYQSELDGFKVVERTFVEKTRWSLLWKIILEKEGKFYSTAYSVGATEAQSEEPFEYSDEEVDLVEVLPQEKIITVYNPRPTTVREEKN